MKKVKIRFLKQGLFEAEVPANFEEMTRIERLTWATDQLGVLSSQTLLECLADFTDGSKTGVYFDKYSVNAAAIMDEDFELVETTQEWEAFVDGYL